MAMEMTEQELDLLKYPIGKQPQQSSYTAEEVRNHIAQIAEFPVELMKFTAGLKPEDYNYSYRPSAWTIAQLIHHLADSHINAYTRVKLAITENNPTIKPYDENKWAALPDANSADDAHVSVIIISGIHHRMAKVLTVLDEAAFSKTYVHPQYFKTVSLAELAALYAWHGAHHLAQMKVALEKRF